jgi:starch-binding outer membrane protein, SusD/RagB family
MKFSNLIYAALLGCLATGCSKVLDKKDLGAVNENDVWNDIELATAYVDRMYARNLPGWSTEYADYSEESDGGGSYMYGQLNENSVNYWPYSDIRHINVLLNEIDAGTLKDADKKKMKSQAWFFRAYQYFELVKRYGGVPLILVPQQRTDDLFVKRNTTSECMKQIVEDLDSAITHLPAISATDKGKNDGHAHKGTAMALKGRVLLYYASPQFDPSQSAAGRWQAAYDANKAAKEYLQSQAYGLDPNFAGLWLNEMNKEAIFVRRYEYSAINGESKHTWSAATRPLDVSQGSSGGNRPTLEMVNTFPMKDGKAINDPASAYQYDATYFWKNRDPRFGQTIAYNGSVWELGMAGRQPGRLQWTFVSGEQNSPTATGFYTRKAIDENQSGIQAFNSSTDWIELRFAEVLLNLAEAANEVGKTEETYTELKAIRARAGIDAGADNMYGLQAGMDKAQMREAILLERQVELAFEGKRFWDLRRLRLFEKELNGKRRTGLRTTLKSGVKKEDALKLTSADLQTKYDQYFQTEVVTMDTQFPINWKPEYYFFALPRQHTQANSNLEQTQGWDGGTFDPLK